MAHFGSIQKICALGASTMGPGTVAQYLKAGRDVSMYVRDTPGASSAQNDTKRATANQAVQDVLSRLSAEGLLTGDINEMMSRLNVTNNLADAARHADLVMESITEDLAVKQQMFLTLDALCPIHTIFATNTSALNPTEIALVLPPARQENFVVMHHFTPPERMPLVETVGGEQTFPATLDKSVAFLREIGKRPIRLHKATPGFIVNPIQAAIIWSALELHVMHGIEPKKIDAVFKEKLGDAYRDLGPLGQAGLEHADLAHTEAETVLAIYKELSYENNISEHIARAATIAALKIVAKGTASAHDVDEAFCLSLGRRYGTTGPLASADMGGLHVFSSIFKTVGFYGQGSPVEEFVRRKAPENEWGVPQNIGQTISAWEPGELLALKGARMAALADFMRGDQQRRHKWLGPAQRPLDGRRQRFPEPVHM